jgi:hypothetical protein
MDKADAYFVDGLQCLFKHNFREAIRLMEEGIKWFPTDAYGLLFNCSLLHGCIDDRHTQHDYVLQCLQLEPEEPIFYYWKGICRKLIVGKNMTQLNQYLQETIACFQHYIDEGYPEGRKFSQAYYEIAFLQSMLFMNQGVSPQSPTFKEPIRQYIRLGQQAEKSTISFFPSLKCDAKRDILNIIEYSEQPEIELRRTTANSYFKAKEYWLAILVYCNIGGRWK